MKTSSLTCQVLVTTYYCTCVCMYVIVVCTLQYVDTCTTVVFESMRCRKDSYFTEGLSPASLVSGLERFHLLFAKHHWGHQCTIHVHVNNSSAVCNGILPNMWQTANRTSPYQALLVHSPTTIHTLHTHTHVHILYTTRPSLFRRIMMM